MVRSILPMGEGVVLDPFFGSGTTIAACQVVSYDSIGVEMDEYIRVTVQEFFGIRGGSFVMTARWSVMPCLDIWTPIIYNIFRKIS